MKPALWIALAATALGTAPPASAQLLAQVNPVKLTLTAPPEKPLHRDLQLTNLGDGTIRAHLRLSDWTMSEDGQLSMAPAGSAAASLAGAITFEPAEFTLAPNQSGWVHLTLRLPDQGPATRWGVVLTEIEPAEAKHAGKGESVELGTTIFLSRIPSDEIQTTLGPIDVIPLGRDSLLVTTRLHNNGERQATVAADFALEDSTGTRVSIASVGGGVVLPGRARRLEWVCARAMRPGAYRVTASLDVGAPDSLLGEARFRWPIVPPAGSVAADPAR